MKILYLFCFYTYFYICNKYLLAVIYMTSMLILYGCSCQVLLQTDRLACRGENRQCDDDDVPAKRRDALHRRRFRLPFRFCSSAAAAPLFAGRPYVRVVLVVVQLDSHKRRTARPTSGPTRALCSLPSMRKGNSGIAFGFCRCTKD